MKKILSLAFTIIISACSILFCAANTYAATIEKESIKSFLEDGVKLIRENDANKEFVPEDTETETPVKNETEYDSTNRGPAKLSVNEDESVSGQTLSETAFQTCRLLVKATKKPDKLNSTGVASGFKDWYIIQFKNEEDAEKAYETYSEDESVLSVSPDLVEDISFDEGESEEPADYLRDEAPTRLNSWGSIMTGLYDVKDYISSHFEYTREITIGVCDVGVDLDNEFIKNRLIRTYFNSSSNGEENSEYTQNAHGTMVSSIIVDNTPDNVRIKVYKFGSGNTASALSAVALALIKAANDRVDIINCSFSAKDVDGFIKDALDYVFNVGVEVIASAGNANHNISLYRWLPGYDDRAISVAGYRNNGNPTAFTSYGQSVDLLAPAQDLPVSGGKTGYSFKNGTSIAAPMVASLFANLMILFPSHTNKQLEHMVYSNADPSDIFYDCGLFGYGIIDAIGSTGFERNAAPSFSLPEGKYIDEIEVEITAELGCEIYYTLDGSYPSKENGICYTGPVKIQDDCPFLKAVAYGNGIFRSECTKSLYRLQRVGTDDMFEISDEGVITSYTGNVYDLIIPEAINGITVSSIAPEVFSGSGLIGITFPNTMDIVPEKAFINCNTLMIADGTEINTIEKEAFHECMHLYMIDFPNVVSIENEAFRGDVALPAAIFPKCEKVGDYAFSGCKGLRKAEFPSLDSTGYYSFRCGMLTEADFPLLKESIFESIRNDYIYCLDLPSINDICETFFYTTFDSDYIGLKRVELSNVKTIESLPFALNVLFNESVSMVIPSTFELHIPGSVDLMDFTNPKAVIYGSQGTYAEQWANENGFEFVEITPETAVITDLPDEFFDYMRYLYADVVGFNRTYQWYGSYSDKNIGGNQIEGATERKFVPKENEQYPYYYCVVTSIDAGYDPIEIRTGTSRYMEFNGDMPNADYSALDEILATVPEDLSIYTDESVVALNETINNIDRNLDASNQATVDGYVEAISNALSALKLKEHTVSFIVNEESVSKYELEYGSEISNIPNDPQKPGYTFTGWSPDIPPTMPNNSLTFTAEFEPVTYYASFMVDGEEKEKVPFTVESTSISEPDVPIKTGYTGKWSEYIIAASDITINAEYIINEYTVSFVADDKTVKSETVEYGFAIEIPDNPQKDGYIFKEWLPKVPETMPAEDMTFYAVFEEEKQPELKPDISIRNFVNSRIVDYRTTITFIATVNNMPEGATIIWYKDGQRAGTGETFTVADAREAFTVQARIVDENGNILDSTETELVKVKSDFFSKIIAFFRMLFEMLLIIEQ